MTQNIFSRCHFYRCQSKHCSDGIKDPMNSVAMFSYLKQIHYCRIWDFCYDLAFLLLLLPEGENQAYKPASCCHGQGLETWACRIRDVSGIFHLLDLHDPCGPSRGAALWICLTEESLVLFHLLPSHCWNSPTSQIVNLSLPETPFLLKWLAPVISIFSSWQDLSGGLEL